MTETPAAQTLRVSRWDQPVHVIADAPTARELLTYLRPYYQVDQQTDTTAGHSGWRVVVGREHEPAPERYEVIVEDSEDETPQRIGICAADRSVLIDEAGAGWRALRARRLTRSLLRWHLVGRGELFFHGAAVAVEGRAIAFMGSKLAGKTSTLLSMLTRPGTGLIANDDVTVVEDSGSWLALGWGRSVRVRRDTLDVLGQPAPYYREAIPRLAHPVHAHRLRRGIPRERWPSFFFDPAELAAASGNVTCAQARLAAILFPVFLDRRASGVRIRRLGDDEAWARALANLENVADRNQPYLQPCFPQIDLLAARRRARRLLNDVPCYELEQSFSALPLAAARLHDLASSL
jgi:hypothetical protein